MTEMDINNFFDRICCINLDRRRDRWEQAKNQFDHAGITNYQRFSAIESENGWEGCRDSHLAIIREARDREFDRVLIFEDDFQFVRGFRRRFDTALTEIQSVAWDMLYLGGNLHGPQTPTKRSPKSAPNGRMARPSLRQTLLLLHIDHPDSYP